MYWFYKIDMAKKIISLRSFEIYNKSALKKNMPNADGISKTRYSTRYNMELKLLVSSLALSVRN